MKRLLIIVVLIAAATFKVDAQSVRLGDRVPAIHVDSELGKELELSAKEYVCMIFIHSESAPCHEAFKKLHVIGDTLASNTELVFVTTEARGCEQNIAHLLEELNYTMAYDIDRRTFKAYGIEYVPCGVIYSTKRKRAEWFGAIHQLNETTLKRITDK